MTRHDPYDLEDFANDDEFDDDHDDDYSDDFPINDYGYDEEDEEDVLIEQTTIHQSRMRGSIGPNSGDMMGGSMHAYHQHTQHTTAAAGGGGGAHRSGGDHHIDGSNITGGDLHRMSSAAKLGIAAEDMRAAETSKPRILLMGLRRSGKSSIQKVVFQKMSPHETLFLESTNKIIKNGNFGDVIYYIYICSIFFVMNARTFSLRYEYNKNIKNVLDISNNSFVQFQIWDFPGQIDFFDSTFESSLIFGGCGALLFVIDAQDEYIEAINKLNQTIQQALRVNRNITFEVFIHKVDGISEDHKIDIQREIQQQVTDSLMDNDLHNVHVRYHLTSIYDHSIFEAFSKVIQKLIPQLPTLENLLDMLVSVSVYACPFLSPPHTWNLTD